MFQAAQESFFAARRAAADAEEAELSANVPAKEAAVAAAEALLPISDVRAAKRELRVIQDRFDAAGEVPRGDAARLSKRMAAVEKAVRDADNQSWTTRNPELEARATGIAAQLAQAIADLTAKVEAANAAGDKAKAKKLGEELASKQAWLKTISK